MPKGVYKKSEEHKKKISKTFKRLKIIPPSSLGRKASEEACRNQGKARKGEKHWNWQGGKDYNLFKNYGITLEQYNQMSEEQNGLCLICKQPSGNRKLAVDHNHQTGEIRGLLCMKCNLGLGMFRHNTLILFEAIKYLKDY